MVWPKYSYTIYIIDWAASSQGTCTFTHKYIWGVELTSLSFKLCEKAWSLCWMNCTTNRTNKSVSLFCLISFCSRELWGRPFMKIKLQKIALWSGYAVYIMAFCFRCNPACDYINSKNMNNIKCYPHMYMCVCGVWNIVLLFIMNC